MTIAAPITPPPADLRYRDVLRACGFPTSCVVLDFETYFDSDYSLKKMPVIEYVTDERFEVLGLAFGEAIDTGGCGVKPFNHLMMVDFWKEADVVLRNLQQRFGPELEGVTVIAQNALFESAVLAYHYGIHPRYFVDTLGLARYVNSRAKNGLADLCKRLGIPDKGDTMEFKGLSNKPRLAKNKSRKKNPPPKFVAPMTPEQFESLHGYAVNDVEREWDVLVSYLPRIAAPELELWLMNHTLRLYTQPTLEVDMEFAAKLKADMKKELAAAAKSVGCTPKELSGNNSFEELLDDALSTAGDSVENYKKQGKKGRILAIAKDDPGLDHLLNHPSEDVRDLVKARAAVKSWPLHIRRVERIVNQAKAAGGKLPVPLKYHGAHTGRWSGGERINLQNLSARNKSDLVNSIRGLIVPPQGNKLVVTDATAVEARGLAWIAGQDDLVQLFEDGYDVYCVYAGRMAGTNVRPAEPTDPPPVKAYLKRMRSMGKIQILGCGYGMGPDKCMGFATGYGVDLDHSQAKELVYFYRDSVPKIVQFWKDVEQSFKFATKYDKATELPRGLRFHKEDNTTLITLPSGRQLHYENVKVGPIQDGEPLSMPDPQNRFNSIHMWGGYLVENIVQALCRDLLGEAIRDLENRGRHVALHTHDEVIIVAPDDEAEDTLAESITALSTPPAWAKGCPLAAEGNIMERYGK